MAHEDNEPATEAQPIDDDALEFVTGGITLCSTASSCTGVTGNVTVNKTIAITVPGG